jgi:heat shock protein HslJ
MVVFRLIAGKLGFVCGAVILALLAGSGLARATDTFPFDQTLMLDVKPMPPVKRVPILTVESNGNATIGLWCKTVRGRVELDGDTIKIEAEPLPDGLPQYMADGQCSDQRMAADQDTLSALAQVTGWRRQGGAVVLIGVTQLKFRPSSN